MDQSRPINKAILLIILAILLFSIGALLSQPSTTNILRSFTNPTPHNKEKLMKAIEEQTPINCSLVIDNSNITYILGKDNQYYFSISQRLADGSDSTSYNMSDGNNIYIWQKDNQQGQLIPIAAPTTTQSASPPTTYTELITKATQIKCSLLKGNNLFFTPPTHINFHNPQISQ